MHTEQIIHEQQLWAIILRGGAVDPGVHFVTSSDNALQVGKQWRCKGTRIAPHAHCAVEKTQNSFLQEVLYIERGRLKIIFFTPEGEGLEERVLEAGDTILLIQGGHGFEVLEDVQMMEVKMGPYDPASKRTIPEKTQ
jgi:hypothetical protein